MRICVPQRRGARRLCLVLTRIAVNMGEGEPGWICICSEEAILGLALQVSQQTGGWCGGRQFSPHSCEDFGVPGVAALRRVSEAGHFAIGHYGEAWLRSLWVT